ncbi:MAG: Jag N-terminal domain-containing protein [Armatimonadetes bacterium]|nr:Jag N-terminal domain-containing protein [Armatimonadota bacterium]
MAETTEATGRTLEEAKRSAAQALGVPTDSCEFEVLEQSSKGLFAKTNYRVRATVVAPAGEPVAARERERPDKEPEAPAEAEAEAEAEAPQVEANDEDARKVAEMVQGIFDGAGADVTVKVKGLTGKYVDLMLSGGDAGLLLAAREPALDSLQYLANAMLSRTLPGGVRVTLDAEEYRAERNAALERLAREVAEQVSERKQEAVLDPLPAHERRVVHRALLEIEGVESYSEGEEPNRRIVISPKG